MSLSIAKMVESSNGMRSSDYIKNVIAINNAIIWCAIVNNYFAVIVLSMETIAGLLVIICVQGT
jgi:hypothetical protein